MKQFVWIGLIAVSVLTGAALAQQSGQGAESSAMHGMMGQRGEESGAGMGGMGGMMRMMKMMEQCSAMMESSGAREAAPARSAKGETALDILKKRYAKGEISREEFERIRKDIE